MSLKLKAALQTLSIIAVITLTVFGLQHLSLNIRQIGVICSIMVLSGLAYIMYLILLNQLEYEQKIDELTKG